MKIIDALVNLLKVKSLMSLGAIAMFIYLVVTHTINGEQAMTIISMVFTAYFVHTANKKDEPTTTSGVVELPKEDE